MKKLSLGRSLRVCASLASAALASCPGGVSGIPEFGSAHAATSTVPSSADADFVVPPPPFSDGVFPCTDCHDPLLPINAKRRKLVTAHVEIELRHDQEHRWCLDCHSAEDRDKLHLAGGERIEFTESYKLCGQCHGDKYRDWRAGVHGKRSGQWDGAKTYMLCVHCHNAHAPAFQPIEPKPAPRRPEGTR
jgi:hypothetical protein